MNKHKPFIISLLFLLMAGSTSLFAANTPDFSLTGEAEDFTYLTCEYYNSGCWTSGDCRIVVCEGEYLKLSTLPNYYVPSWTGPNGYSYTGQDVNLGYVSVDQAGEYQASYTTSSGYELTTTIIVDVLTEPTLTIEETHETCHGWDGALDLTVSDLPSGVFFELYEGSFSYLPEHFNTNYRDQSGISSTGFDVSLAGRDTRFAMRFSATLTVPTTGTYTFYTASDDGSKLYIDGTRIVNNDGYHTLRERSGTVHLTAGQHQIVVSYFRGNTGEPLQVKYKGPGISKRHIPTSVLTVPYAVHWSNGARTEDLTGIDDGNYSVWVKYGGYNCTADAHATVNPGWDYLTDPGRITSSHFVDCIEDGQETVDPPAFETTAATCRSGKQADYQWQEKTSMSGSWANIPGATDQDYDPEPRGAGSSWYRRLAKCDCGSGYASNASTNVRDIHIKEAAWDNVVLGCNVGNCDGVCDGSIRVDANFNKTGEYTVQYTFNGTVVTAPGTYTGIGFNTIGGLCAGTYSDITITGVHTGCSAVWPDDIVITEPTGPQVMASGGDPICEGENITLTAVASGGTAPLSIVWMPGGQTTSSITVSPETTTTYTVEVTDDNGCTDTDHVTVTVKDPPTATIHASVTAICSEESVTFTAGPSATGSKYTWDFGEYAIDRYRSGAGPHEVTFVLPDDLNGNDWTKAMLTVINNGCEDIARKTIDIRDLPEVTSVESTDPACDGNNGSITVFFVDNPNRSHISFSLNGAAGPFTTVRDTEGSLTFDDLGEGDYDLFVKWGNNQCGTDLDDVTLTAQPGPEVEVSGGEVICSGESVTLTASASGGTAPLTITWMPGGETGESITVIPDETTTYTATVTDANGCTASDDATIETIDDVLTDPGEITTGHYFECVEDGQTADPPTFEATPATCSDGSPAIYQWQEKTSMGGVWTDIPGATDKDYDPEPRGISSSWYRRQAKCDCDSDFASSNVRDVHIKELPEVTVVSTGPDCDGNSGSITVFFVDNPARTHISFSLNGAAGPFTTVPDSDGSLTFDDLGEGSYDLFVKWGNGQCGLDLEDVVFTAPCCADVEIVCDNPEITVRDVSMVADCRQPVMNGFFATNSNLSASPFFDVINGKFTENLTDGTATFTATVINQGDNNVIFDLVMNFSGRTNVPVEGSPKENTLCIGDLDNSDWYYYLVFTGQLIGAGAVDGAVVNITRDGEPFQVGTGANLFDENVFGASGWILFDVVSQSSNPDRQVRNGRGDVNVNLSEAEPIMTDCLNICAGESSVLSATASGSPDFEYEWSTGETTPSITVSPMVDTEYSVTITDADGCVADATVEVIVNDVPFFSVVKTDADCELPNGSAMVVGASSADLTYSWSNGETGPSVSGLSVGSYGVTATSPAGCTAVEYFTIDSSPRVRAHIRCDNPELVTRDVSMVQNCSNPTLYGFFATNSNLAGSSTFDIFDGKFVENLTDGTAVFTAKVVNRADDGISFDLVATFSGRTDVPPVGSPKEEFLCVGDIDNSDWYYYPELTGHLTGTDDMVGAEVTFVRDGESFQVGTGANLFDENSFGASGWILFTIVSQPDNPVNVIRNGRGDINVNLSGDANTPPVPADCFNIIAGESSTLTAGSSTGTPDFTYLWSTGETTPTITVSPTQYTPYSVTITDANGCTSSATVFVRVTDPGSARAMVTETEDGAEGVAAGGLTDTETAPATEAEQAKLSAPVPTAPASVWNNEENVFELDQNAPNPFSDETAIRFTLPEAGNATLTVIDLTGRQVREIRQDFAAGRNVVQLDGEGLAAGTYVYTLIFNGQRLTRRMIHMPR